MFRICSFGVRKCEVPKTGFLWMGKRGPQCTVCAHRERAAIDLGIARGVSFTALARRYSLSASAVQRHGQNHLPPQLRAQLIAGPDLPIDLDKLRETESQSLLANLVALRHRLFAALDTAEEYQDAGMLTRVASQLHANLELTGKLLGDLGVGTTNVMNVLILPQYIELRVALVQALSAFPEAKLAVAQALHQLESKAAETIKPKDLAS
jgi:hypothetical protein